MAVLKSNAYGHGLEAVGKICVQGQQVDWFGVDNIDEALTLRKAAVKQSILVLGYIPLERIGEAIGADISFVAYNTELLDYLAKLPSSDKKNKKAKIHIKVETGTARQGIADEELLEFANKASKNPKIFVEGIYTHFSNIEDTTDSSFAIEQLKKFDESITIVGGILHRSAHQSNKLIKHSACSAAIINYPATHFDMVRAGISLYGYWPSPETKAVAKEKGVRLELKPAMTWKTRIAQIKKLKINTPVGYGLTETVKRDSRVAVLPIGYWDGYDRKLSSIGEVLIRNKRAKILGRICMNMAIADVTDIPKARVFDEVVLLGRGITADELAKKIGTINYEVVTRINPLIRRIMV